MSNTHTAQIEFNEAKRAALECLTSLDEFSPSYLQIAIDRMTQAFEKIAPVTLPAEPDPAPEVEILSAYAVRIGDARTGYRWRVLFVNGEPLEEAPSVSEFTRQLVSTGWRVTNVPACEMPAPVYTPDGQPVYELYFRKQASETHPTGQLETGRTSSPVEHRLTSSD
jgi:hypothetical protein